MCKELFAKRILWGWLEKQGGIEAALKYKDSEHERLSNTHAPISYDGTRHWINTGLMGC
jgi:hypothetical protein